MNHFEHDVQSKNNDVKDSMLAFGIGLGTFSAIYIIAQIFDLLPK
ncbi:YqzM family protein [Macrococcus equipercicus]|uniref:YqzM family protein n=1 Tax=Macrococcus equipercicus TaxID=69967 RepID=A0A9Q9BKS0_9STAP|nr:YqzM family protein [Macrococcus equipercicus]KAA1040056.1 YqzM family protein [Macrococcus equipercicus]UTH12995.1 YqzM family protein [Macrococcus equipercicus]